MDWNRIGTGLEQDCKPLQSAPCMSGFIHGVSCASTLTGLQLQALPNFPWNARVGGLQKSKPFAASLPHVRLSSGGVQSTSSQDSAQFQWLWTRFAPFWVCTCPPFFVGAPLGCESKGHPNSSDIQFGAGPRSALSGQGLAFSDFQGCDLVVERGSPGVRESGRASSPWNWAFLQRPLTGGFSGLLERSLWFCARGTDGRCQEPLTEW